MDNDNPYSVRSPNLAWQGDLRVHVIWHQLERTPQNALYSECETWMSEGRSLKRDCIPENESKKHEIISSILKVGKNAT
jgi:hypothetical protein